MNTELYSVPGQTEDRRKVFFEWKSIDLLIDKHMRMSMGVNVNYYENVHHAIRIHRNREHPGNFQITLVSSPFN